MTEDEHPLAGLVDRVREAGMVQIQTEIAAALPMVSTALDRDGDFWSVHVTWSGNGWARLTWHPEHAFALSAACEPLRTYAGPHEAIDDLAAMVRGRLP